MELTPKKELMIKLFCILVIIGLDLLIYFNGKDLSCDKCSIYFKSFKTEYISSSRHIYQNISIPINQLYKSYIEDYCIIEFEEKQGYYLKDDKQIK